MNEPLVSIIIPCYNAEELIGEAIESALAQSYPKVEVIVIDDGSTDGSLAVIRSFGRCVRWESGPNRGGCAARNRGIKLARGELVQFLDADDLLSSYKLEQQVPHALAGGRKSMSICLGRTDLGDKYLDWQYARILDPDRDPVDFILGGILHTEAPLHWINNLCAVGGFDECLPCAQEFDLHLRLVCAGQCLSQLRESLFIVRRQPQSVSSDAIRVTRQQHYILGKASELLSSLGVLSPNRARSIAMAYANAAIGLDLGSYPVDAALCREEARTLCPEAEILAWTPKWRLFVRILGATRVARIRRWLRHLLPTIAS